MQILEHQFSASLPAPRFEYEHVFDVYREQPTNVIEHINKHCTNRDSDDIALPNVQFHSRPVRRLQVRDRMWSESVWL